MKGITITTPRSRQRPRDPQTLLAGALTRLLLRVSGARRIALALGAAALLAIAAGTALTASASAAATITRYTITDSGSESGLTDECRPGLTGTIFGTTVFRFQEVDTDQGIHFIATDSGTGRIEWSDGSYSLTESSDRFVFNTSFNGATVFTSPHVDSVTTYSADGVFLFRATLHRIQHVTITDGEVVRVEFEKGRFHIFGDC
jgi:hypothetical protein